MEATETSLAPRTIVGIREVVDDPGKLFTSALPALFARAEGGGQTYIGPPLGVYYHVDDGSYDMAVAFLVEDAGDAAEAGLFVDTLDPGRAYIGEYQGPYDGIPEAWSDLMAAIPDDVETTMPCWEEYHTGPESDPNPINWRTTLVQPIS
jgi:effector-binding domain-containing protein